MADVSIKLYQGAEELKSWSYPDTTLDFGIARSALGIAIGSLSDPTNAHTLTEPDKFIGLAKGSYDSAVEYAKPAEPTTEVPSQVSIPLTGLTELNLYLIDNTTTLVNVYQNAQATVSKRWAKTTTDFGIFDFRNTIATSVTGDFAIGHLNTENPTDVTGLQWKSLGISGVTFKGFTNNYNTAGVMPSVERTVSIVTFKWTEYKLDEAGEQVDIHVIDDTTTLVTAYSDRAKQSPMGSTKRFVSEHGLKIARLNNMPIGEATLTGEFLIDGSAAAETIAALPSIILKTSLDDNFKGITFDYDTAISTESPAKPTTAVPSISAKIDLSGEAASVFYIDNTTTYVKLKSSKVTPSELYHRCKKDNENLVMKLEDNGAVKVYDNLSSQTEAIWMPASSSAQGFEGVKLNDGALINAPTSAEAPVVINLTETGDASTVEAQYSNTGYTVIIKNVDEAVKQTLSGITKLYLKKDSITTDIASQAVTGLDATTFYGLATSKTAEHPDNGLFRYQEYAVSSDLTLYLIQASDQVYDIQFKVADDSITYKIAEVTKSPSDDLNTEFFTNKTIGKNGSLGKFCSRGSKLQEFSFKLEKVNA